MNFLLQQCGTNNQKHIKDTDNYLILKNIRKKALVLPSYSYQILHPWGGAISHHNYVNFL